MVGMARARASSRSSRAQPFGITPGCRCRSAGCWCATRRVKRSRRPSCAPTWTPTPPTSCAGSSAAGAPRPPSRVRGTAPDRRHLGVESQRQWSDLAILRTTPALLGLFSLVTLWAARLDAEHGLSPECVRWYPKRAPTFSDALARVRRELWLSPTFASSQDHRDVSKIPADVLDRLIRIACRPP